MILTSTQLQLIMPRIPKSRLDQYTVDLNGAMELGQINTKDRIAMFLAQLAHESCEFKYQREVWGPLLVPAQQRYERNFNAAWPPTTTDKTNKLAYTLGNSKKNDGYVFRGWGPIQCTGRSNTLACSLYLYQDDRLVKNPTLLNTFEVGLLGAIWYWTTRDLNTYADKKDIKGATKIINGGYNGLTHRQSYYDKAQEVL